MHAVLHLLSVCARRRLDSTGYIYGFKHEGVFPIFVADEIINLPRLRRATSLEFVEHPALLWSSKLCLAC